MQLGSFPRSRTRAPGAQQGYVPKDSGSAACSAQCCIQAITASSEVVAVMVRSWRVIHHFAPHRPTSQRCIRAFHHILPVKIRPVGLASRGTGLAECWSS